MTAVPSQAQFKLCFPNTTWFGSPSGPAIDGRVTGDAGWQGAFRYVFGNGTTTPYTVVQGIRDSSNNLYLSFEGESLPSLTNTADPSTIVVLAFDFRSSGGGLQEISVKPVVAGPTIQTNPASIVGVNSGPVKFWTGTASVAGVATWTQISPTPSWLLSPNNQVGYLQSPSGDYHWFLEMKLPITSTATPTAGITLPTTGMFGLYINVFRVVSGNYVESYWPPLSVDNESGCSSVGSCTPDTSLPNPGPVGSPNWGTSTIDPAQSCGGVSVGSQNNDIFTNNTPNSTICVTAGVTSGGSSCPANPNIFTAKVHNTTIDGSGTFQSAPNVQATFLLANFGLPSQWTAIPVTHNPTTATNLGANSTTSLSTDSWFPVPNASDYDPTVAGSHPHQCIQVTLDSTSGNVDFINNAAIQNMDFVHLSRFQRNAEISAKGYPARPDNPDGTHNIDQLFDLQVFASKQVSTSKQSSTAAIGSAGSSRTGGAEEGPVVSQLTWIVEGCRHTGRFMTDGNRKLEVCDSVGGFGYVMQHAAAADVKEWNLQFSGTGLTPVPGQPNRYQLHVAQDGVATVSTSADPEEPHSGRFAVFFDAGANFPQGAFGSTYKTGFSLNAGLEYIVTSHFSIEGIFGYHHFRPNAIGDLNLYQYSVNGKTFLTGGPFRPFVNAGIGGYKFGGASTYFGGNVGAGLLFQFSSRVGLEGSYNFHVIDTAVATKFSTAQFGIRFEF